MLFRKAYWLPLFIILFTSCHSKVADKSPAVQSELNNELKDGDIIFQTSLSSQSKAIQLATHSQWSHMGIIFKQNENWYVYEASNVVKATKLGDWIARGKEGHYVIKRDKNPLAENELAAMKTYARQLLGKKYDLYFEWSDEKIYCSELVWKVYEQGAHIQIGKLQKLKDFDLSNEAVRQKMKERFGDKIPYTETVISPDAIFQSNLLMQVTER